MKEHLQLWGCEVFESAKMLKSSFDFVQDTGNAMVLCLLRNGCGCHGHQLKRVKCEVRSPHMMESCLTYYLGMLWKMALCTC